MKLIDTDDLRGRKVNYAIITGDGKTELRVLRGLSQKLNGEEIILYFPLITSSRKTGLSALNAVKEYPNLYQINSLIFIVDRDTFSGEPPDIKIKEYLTNIGIDILNINPIKDAYLINCKFGPYNITLFCIILGPEIFIEEEIAILFRLKLGQKISLSGEKNYAWKDRVKSKIYKILRESNIRLENLIKNTGINILEQAFPNLCAVLKKIEEDFHNNAMLL